MLKRRTASAGFFTQIWDNRYNNLTAMKNTLCNLNDLCSVTHKEPVMQYSNDYKTMDLRANVRKALV